METTINQRRWPRSIAAVFGGMLMNVIPAVAMDAGLHATGVYPPVGQPMSDALYVLAFSYRLVLAVAGGYVTAWIAPAKPMKHALVLGVIGFILSTVGAFAMRGVGPAWYAIGLILISVPGTLAGAKLLRRV